MIKLFYVVVLSLTLICAYLFRCNTDIMMAGNCGLHSLLVLTGIHTSCLEHISHNVFFTLEIKYLKTK